MFDGPLRLVKERLLAPVVRFPLNRISPNGYTWAAFAVGLGAGGAAWGGKYSLALGLWGVNRLLDGLDGTVARVTHRQTDFGAWLDIVLDHVVYAAIPLGIALAIDQSETYLALALLLGSFYINAASWMYLAGLLERRLVDSDARLTRLAMPVGLIEGAETIVFYTLFLLFPAQARPLFQVMAAGVLLTALQRLLWTWRRLE
jgi:phosphatidylglycerophosphate synthase